MGRPKKELPNRADGLYEIKITIGKKMDGTLIRKSFYSSISKDDAKKQAGEWKVEREVSNRTGELFLEQNLNFEQWAHKWLLTYKKGKVKENTYNSMYYVLVEKTLIPYFGRTKLTDIRPITIQDFFDHHSTTYSLETLKKCRAILKAIFASAVENELCFKNPITTSLKLSSKKDTPIKRTYSQKEFELILEFAKSHLSGLSVWVLLETGISRSELLGLKWGDIDFKDHIININQGTVDIHDPELHTSKTVSTGLKNEFRNRPIPINPELSAALESKPRVILTGTHKQNVKSQFEVAPEFIFHSPTGGVFSPKNWMNRVFVPFMEEFHAIHPEIEILNPHELRHTRATLWKDAGVDLFTIAKLLGHSDLDMLAKRYAHNNTDTLKKALGL